jgi:glycosyltransferase involved in cell wall biosynthesis
MEEIGKRLVENHRHEVTIFSSSYAGGEIEEHRSGMRIVRGGGKYSVYSKARKYAKTHLSEYDLIIDEINTVPFRAKTIANGKPVIALVHQLAREIWFYETRFPISLLGYFALEPLWLREYRKIPTITVSESTRGDLFHRGFEKVEVVHNGIGTKPLPDVPTKDVRPILIFLARLVRCKRPQHAIEAFERVKAIYPKAELWVVGDGYLKFRLQKQACAGVKFFGRVSDSEKFELLKQARVLLAPSVREGWGISVIEANAMGTPAVGYDVPGLRDSIIHGSTGYLVEPGDVDALARTTLRILSEPALENSLCNRSLQWARNFNWENSTQGFNDLLQAVANPARG